MSGHRWRLVLVAPLLVLALILLVAWTTGGRAPRNDMAPLVVAASAPLSGATPEPVAAAGEKQSRVSRAWVVRIAAATGVPAPAIRAYAVATLGIGRDEPGCHLSWTTLAGIGWVESQHGTIGGRRLRADGRSSTAIFGPPLDGSAGVIALPHATADEWQRAGGPMQFLSSTWERWESDGDRDGARDRQDLDDAAYAAARYLCASGQDLSTGAGWVESVHSYNHSDEYVLDVFAAAQAYADRSG